MSEAQDRPLILLTNDDGYRAAGLLALRAELSSVARVITVAPAREMSGTSHSITLGRPLSVEEFDADSFAVDGTPSDCVTLAIHRLLPTMPAAIVSGINHGGNLGDDVGYSATVGAAVEGCLAGIPSLAVSQVKAGPASDFSPAARIAAAIVLALASRSARLAPGTFLNMNVPADPPRGLSVTTLSRRRYENPIEERAGLEGRAYFWVGGRPIWESVPGNDHHAVIGLGHVSLSLLGTDWSLAVPGGRPATEADLADLGSAFERARATITRGIAHETARP